MTNIIIDKQSFGYYGDWSQETLRRQPEVLAQRLDAALKGQAQPAVEPYKGFSKEDTSLGQRIAAASETDTRTNRPTLDETLKAEAEARGEIDWDKKTENELKTMNLDEYPYQPIPHLIRDFIEGGEDD